MTQRLSPAKRWATSGLTLAGVLAFTGCATKLGPQTVGPDRFNYNQSILDSADEQMLLNLVRLRYRDRAMFLELQSVVSQRSLQARINGGATVGVGGGSDNEYPIGGSLGFEEKPTVTYTPLQGEAFAERILTPIAPETIILLSSSGWSIERLFLTCVSRLNGIENAPTATGPTPDEAPEFEEFQEVAGLLRLMQKSGMLRLQVYQRAGAAQPEVQVMLDVPTAGDGAETAEVARIRERLGLQPGRHQLRLSSALEPATEGEFAINPRSLMGIFFYLSQAVEPPPEHEAQGLVTVTRDAEGNRFDWTRVTGRLLRIHSSSTRPKNAFTAVRYRDHWFYVEDRDLDSKTTLNLLHFLFSLKSGGGKAVAPVLTLPAG